MVDYKVVIKRIVEVTSEQGMTKEEILEEAHEQLETEATDVLQGFSFEVFELVKKDTWAKKK